MGGFIKKNSGFLYWVLMPSLLLVASIFGVNLVSRPVLTQVALSCSVDADCNNNSLINPNGCRIFICDTSFLEPCRPAGIDLSKPGCGLCGDGVITCNHNGICEEPPENSANCDDCLVDLGGGPEDLCRPRLVRGNLIDAVPNGLVINPCSPNRNYCCPSGCQGTNPNDSLFDIDCACCGDSLTNSFEGTPEQCDPAGSACDPASGPAGSGTCSTQCQCLSCGDGIITPPEQCEGQGSACKTATGVSGTCNNCQCVSTVTCGNGVIDPGEQCEPPNTITCDANCQNIPPTQPVCGNGIVETGEQCEGTTCSVTESDGSVIPGVCQNCQCLPQCEAEGSGCGHSGGTQGPCFVGSGTAGGSLIPPPVHPTVLAQWIAAFGAPGGVFIGMRLKRRTKNSS